MLSWEGCWWRVGPPLIEVPKKLLTYIVELFAIREVRFIIALYRLSYYVEKQHMACTSRFDQKTCSPCHYIFSRLSKLKQ